MPGSSPKVFPIYENHEFPGEFVAEDNGEALLYAHWMRDSPYKAANAPKWMSERIEFAWPVITRLCRELKIENPKIFFFEANDQSVAFNFAESGGDPCIAINVAADYKDSEEQLEVSIYHELGHNELESRFGSDREVEEEEGLVETFARMVYDEGIEAAIAYWRAEVGSD